MQAAAYEAFTGRLVDSVRDDVRVQGLIAMGSMADASRRDVWSDHDFFLVVEPGTQAAFRESLDWLPDPEAICLWFQETAHGLKVLYENGHLLEFAVFDRDELESYGRATAYQVLLDRTGDLANLMASLRVSPGRVQVDMQRGLSHCLTLLVVGAGRCARGEILSGSQFIKHHALSHLLPVLLAVRESEADHHLDRLDPFRRVEQVYPDLAARLQAIWLREPIQAARDLLDLIEADLAQMADYPAGAVAVVRAHVARADTAAGPGQPARE